MTLKLIPNKPIFWEFIRLLRADERVQAGFIKDTPEISQEQQEKYMEKYNDNYYICLLENKPCGFIGEIDGDIRVCTHPDYQGKGVGSFMIKELTNLRPNIYAKVKIDNISSVKAFEKAGYEKKYFILEPTHEIKTT
jgi:RimJ/RimL family protein N-acetyltransferase